MYTTESCLKSRSQIIQNPMLMILQTFTRTTVILFSNINPVEVKVYNDTIDFEIRISEGKIAYFDEISSRRE